MGSSPEATLVYGYYLGGDDPGWAFEEGEDLEDLILPWYEDDLVDDAPRYLLRTIGGFTETDSTVDGYFDRRHAAQAVVGVEFLSGGGDAYSVNYLASFSKSGDWGEPVYVDFDELESERVLNAWDRKLEDAVKALGLTPKLKPSWIVFSFYG